MSRPICVIGNTNIDLVLGTVGQWPEPGTEVFLKRSDYRTGGSAANTALVLQRLGVSSGLVSATGNDPHGEMLRARFRGPLDRVRTLDAPTGISVGVLFDHAERSFLSFNGHLDAFQVSDVTSALGAWPLNGAIVLISGAFAMPGLLQAHDDLTAFLTARGAEIAIDPGWPGDGWSVSARDMCLRWLRGAHHCLFNDKEVMGLAGTEDLEQAIGRLSSYLRAEAVLVVKCGARGAIAAGADGRCQVPAEQTHPFDTIGAGDSFNAGYLAGIAQGLTLPRALEQGTSVASRVIAEFPRKTSPLEAQPARTG
ncbi:carbohydrate kinase family protein [Roseibium marinum]|uniref:Sugar/nucleoside kinase (Ribokinase family) n=1 Tax=Roseibium marinum TaxID=281252 RepID=A0A2S3UJX5_9HYPH|nr:carbohydrate kinase family protein [Roseibium marinum]POF27997.1 sugar/nucleoside kinase (ribokinase family) [Roseibium marinum]